jgi:probable F420-dependent oxidoreductase
VKLGLFGINIGPLADPDRAARVARAAEDAGFDSVWTGEHVVLPDPQRPPSPASPQEPFLDPAAALAFLAAHTRTLRLATGIIILPQRNPLVLAKELASVDVLSGGRLVFGLGAGYLEPEFRALGADFAARGARTDEYLDAILALWTREKPAFAGPTVRFEGIDARPRPLQKPHPPIVVGGLRPPALRRAVQRGNGWYGFLRTPEAAAADLAGLAEAGRRVERPAALGPLEVSVTPPPGCDADMAARYRDLGVDRLVLLPTARDADGLLRFVAEAGERLVRKLR